MATDTTTRERTVFNHGETQALVAGLSLLLGYLKKDLDILVTNQRISAQELQDFIMEHAQLSPAEMGALLTKLYLLEQETT